MGWGLGSWAFGSPYYGWGYAAYSNPYYVPVAVGGGDAGGGYSYDYSTPIDTTAQVGQEGDASRPDPGAAAFDQARQAFRDGDYTQARALTDQALQASPNDVTLHEFDGLVDFARGEYQKAAAAMYAVLSVGPGWDWTTLIGLYANPETYTTQLRALEAFVEAHPDDPAAHFVLASHYMTQSHVDAAADQFRAVARLQPKDTLAAQMVATLDPKAAPATASNTASATATAPAAAVAPAGPQHLITGTWVAAPAPDRTITLTIEPDGKFTWTVGGKAQAQPTVMQGTSTSADGMLKLDATKGGTLAGQTQWADASHFTFKLFGGPPDDPGLSFTKNG
jgi:predicted Zn-dependent protease